MAGQTWGAPVKVYQNTTAGGGPLWCPKITVVDDTLYLFISGIAPNSCEQDSNPLGGSAWPPGGSLVLVNSTDNGETWSDVQVQPTQRLAALIGGGQWLSPVLAAGHPLCRVGGRYRKAADCRGHRHSQWKLDSAVLEGGKRARSGSLLEWKG